MSSFLGILCCKRETVLGIGVYEGLRDYKGPNYQSLVRNLDIARTVKDMDDKGAQAQVIDKWSNQVRKLATDFDAAIMAAKHGLAIEYDMIPGYDKYKKVV